jgi:O-acetyl-ADP-ribose deacetylase (regulator of RNase III)
MNGLQYQKGNIFDASTQVIVNTVNCEGVMGKGLALAFRQKYPAMFTTYQKECNTGKLRIGRPTLYTNSTPWILNFPTKKAWRANSKLEYLEEGLEYFVQHYKEAGIVSIAFPKLGAQNGKLSWDDVGPLMAKYLSKLDIDIYIYIAEGDKEYYNNTTQEENLVAWQCFNEVALSIDRLRNEIGLNPRDAKKVSAYRTTKDFTSKEDIGAIDGLAKTSLKRINEYIHSQKYIEQKLPNMEERNISKKPRKAKASKRPKKSPKTQLPATSLFSV